MNIKELLNIAAETGKDLPLDRYGVMFSHEQLLRFADKLTAIEREACARVAEERFLDKANCTAEEMYELQKKSIAAAIRARGDALTKLNKAAENNGEEL